VAATGDKSRAQWRIRRGAQTIAGNPALHRQLPDAAGNYSGVTLQ